MDRNYLQRQVNLYQNDRNPRVRDDALWRVASSADLIRGDVQQLDEETKQKTIDWLRQQGFRV